METNSVRKNWKKTFFAIFLKAAGFALATGIGLFLSLGQVTTAHAKQHCLHRRAPQQIQCNKN